MSNATSWALGCAGAAALTALAYTQWLAPKIAVEPAGAAGVTPAARAPGPRLPATIAVAADYRGHYLVHPTIENFRVRMMVDSGASLVALTAEDAKALGLTAGSNPRWMTLSTANGSVSGFRAVLKEIRLGEIVVRNVDAVVLPQGALSISLLGNSFLGKLTGYEVQTGRMVLRG